MKLGYQPNEVARSLKRKSSCTIGLMIADISNPFYARCAKAVEEVAREHGYAVLLCASNEDVDIERSYIDLLNRRRIDGLLLVPATNGRSVEKQHIMAFPMVAFDAPWKGTIRHRSSKKSSRNANRCRAPDRTWPSSHSFHRRPEAHLYCKGQKHTYTVKKRLEGYREA